jgi:hypothetical protein
VGKGRVVYVAEVKPAIAKPAAAPMTNQYWKLPVNQGELIEAVRWASNGKLMLEVQAAPVTVTVNLLKQRSSGAMQIHFINYDVSGNTYVENIRVSFRLPIGATTAQVKIFSPDNDEVQSVKYVTQDGTLECELPFLKVYSVLEVR